MSTDNSVVILDQKINGDAPAPEDLPDGPKDDTSTHVEQRDGPKDDTTTPVEQSSGSDEDAFGAKAKKRSKETQQNAKLRSNDEMSESSDLESRKPSYRDTVPQFDDEEEDLTETQHIHVRIQQRNGRKTLTTVDGIPSIYDPKKLLKTMKKEFACNGNVVSVDEGSEAGKLAPPDTNKKREKGIKDTKGQGRDVIQLQGDQRSNIFNFLVDNGMLPKLIKVHGF